jgi:rod shape-determining protein MreB
MAIDLGTANTLVYAPGRGVVTSEPSVVALDTRTSEVYAVGDQAKRMIGRTPSTISAVRPLRHGVIADFEVTAQMLRYFMRAVPRGRFAHPRLVICAPSGITEVERRAVEEACLAAGASSVHLIEEALAAAIGAGLPIAEPTGHGVVDVGGGTSEVAVISMGAIVVSSSLRTGGYDLDEAILQHVRRRHDLVIGQPTAEQIKFEIGSAAPLEEELEMEVRGRHLVSGLPKTVTLSSTEVRDAIAEPLQAIVDAVRSTLERTPPMLAADIVEHGILLAGGGSLLRRFLERIEIETGMPVMLAESPLSCVAIGSGLALDELDELARMRGGEHRGTLNRLGRAPVGAR